MDDFEFKELEQFIHEKLENLPERKAPADFAATVLKKIAEGDSRSWWQKPFTYWPGQWQCLLTLGLFACCAAVVFIASRITGQLSVTLSEWTPTLGKPAIFLFGYLIGTVKGAWDMISGFGYPGYIAVGVVIAAFYLGTIASGIALYKLAFQKSFRTA